MDGKVREEDEDDFWNDLHAEGNEWKEDVHLCIGEGDILQAFDHVAPDVVRDAVLAWGIPRVLIAAILREGSGLTCVGSFESLQFRFPLNKSLRQGGKEPCVIFRAVSSWILAPVLARWLADGLGFPLLTRTPPVACDDNSEL